MYMLLGLLRMLAAAAAAVCNVSTVVWYVLRSLLQRLITACMDSTFQNPVLGEKAYMLSLHVHAFIVSVVFMPDICWRLCLGAAAAAAGGLISLWCCR
jgi:hypothetical protein